MKYAERLARARVAANAARFRSLPWEEMTQVMREGWIRLSEDALQDIDNAGFMLVEKGDGR